MKVVYIKDLEGQGKRGEVHTVKNGFARNFLLPQGYAVFENDAVGKSIISQVEKEKAAAEAEIAQIKDKLAELQDLELVFKKKITEKGKLFAAVKAEDIAGEFKKKSNLEASKVELEEPIKEAGEQSVELHLAHGLSLFVTVKVVAEK